MMGAATTSTVRSSAQRLKARFEVFNRLPLSG